MSIHVKFGRGPSLTWPPFWSFAAKDLGHAPEQNHPQMAGSLNAKLEYGLPALGGQGLWVPFADISLIDEGGLDIRPGGSLKVADSRHLSLKGGHLGDTEDVSGYGIGLWSRMCFRSAGRACVNVRPGPDCFDAKPPGIPAKPGL